MKIIESKWKMLLYGCGGMGVNMLNLMMGSYLCSALLIGGFSKDAIPFQTYLSKDIIVAAVWSVFVLVAKIIDGIIDIPMASFTDNLRSKWGRRRPAILIGMILMVISYLLFLVIPNHSGVSIGNTIYYGIVLCFFYSFYTLTMVTYYATFTEIVDNEKDRNYISNVKSVCDIVYFILGYVVVRLLLNGLNIRIVALIVLPLVLTMCIPLFMIKEESTAREKDSSENVSPFKGFVKATGRIFSETFSGLGRTLVRSIAYTFKNRDFILWMIVYSFMTFGVQLFLGGINEYFSYTSMSMIYVMMAAFAPVPLTLMLYNHIIRRRGFRFAFQYVLLVFSLSMFMMFGCSFVYDGIFRVILSIVCGLVASLGIGALFSVAYSIPSQLAAEDEERTGESHSAMYFAVQGLFSGVATGIATGIVLTALKGTETNPTDGILYLTVISAIGCLVAFGFTFILPDSIVTLGQIDRR